MYVIKTRDIKENTITKLYEVNTREEAIDKIKRMLLLCLNKKNFVELLEGAGVKFRMPDGRMLSPKEEYSKKYMDADLVFPPDFDSFSTGKYYHTPRFYHYIDKDE